MKKFLLFLWQFPQNLLGFMLTIVLLNCYKPIKKDYWVFYNTFLGSVSLGNFIFINGYSINEITIKHEFGHQKQSVYLGWLYLVVIGIPSVLGNLLCRIISRNWNYKERIKYYYNQPWEKWADKLGGVKRNYDL